MSRNVKQNPVVSNGVTPRGVGEDTKAKMRAKLLQRIQKSPREESRVGPDENVNTLNRAQSMRARCELTQKVCVVELILFAPTFPSLLILNDL